MVGLNQKGLLLIFATALISGLSIFLNAFAVKGFDSSIFTFAKNIVVAILLFAVLLGFGLFTELKKLKRKQWLHLSAIGLIGGSIPFLLFFKGLQLSTGTTGSFIHKTLFVFVAILALLFLKEKFNWGWLIGAIFVMSGTYFIMRPAYNFSIGYLLIFGAVVLWAIENVYAKHVLKELSGTVVAFGRMFFGSLFIFVYLLFVGKIQVLSSMNGLQYGWIMVTAALLFFYVLTYYNGLKTVDASIAASILTIGAPITALFDVLLRGQTITVMGILGNLFVVIGVLCIVWYSKLYGIFSKWVDRNGWN